MLASESRGGIYLGRTEHWIEESEKFRPTSAFANCTKNIFNPLPNMPILGLSNSAAN